MVDAPLAESPILEYKGDLSETWLEGVTAFANTFGGIIIIGVKADNEIPKSLDGFFDRSEAELTIINRLISCVQPRPEFNVKTARLPADPTKWLAMVRVKEGWDTPYMYSLKDKHRFYIRSGTRKVEPDYLQFQRLVEKRKTASDRANRASSEIQRLRGLLNPHSAGRIVSTNFYRFIAAAQANSGGSIDLAKETAFSNQVINAFFVDKVRSQEWAATMTSGPWQWERTPLDTSLAYFFHQGETPPQFERKWTMSNSAIGFASVASHDVQTQNKLFSLGDFVFDLISFLLLARNHFEAANYYGELELWIELLLPETTLLHDRSVLEYPAYGGVFPNPSDCLNVGRDIHGQALASGRISVQPFTRERVSGALTQLLNQIARSYGGVLRSDLAFVQPFLHDLGVK